MIHFLIFIKRYLKSGLVFPALFIPFLSICQWTSQNNGLGSGVDVDVVNASTAYIVGGSVEVEGSGYILKTTNGGSSVTKIYEQQNAYYTSVFFLDLNNGFVVGSEKGEGVLLKTTNAGGTWIKQPLPFTLNIHGVYFLDAQTGFVFSGFGGVDIFKTSNGGATWTKVEQNNAFRAIGLQFINATTGFLAN
jgi:photosystem II stability/assembly factor-like uncharacterized protein